MRFLSYFRKKRIGPVQSDKIVIIDKQIQAGTCPVKNELLKRFQTDALLIPKNDNLDDLLLK